MWRGAKVIEHGILRAKQALPAYARIQCMCADLLCLLKEFKPPIVVIEVMIERQHTRKNERTTSLAVCATAMGAMWGVAMVACAEWSGQVAPVSNTTWTRGSSKADRAIRAKILCPEYDAEKDKGFDRADAITLGDYFRQRQIKAALGIAGHAP